MILIQLLSDLRNKTYQIKDYSQSIRKSLEYKNALWFVKSCNVVASACSMFLRELTSGGFSTLATITYVGTYSEFETADNILFSINNIYTLSIGLRYKWK